MAKTRHESPRTAMRCAEMGVLLNAVLDRLPGLRLDPDADDPRIHGPVFRSPPNCPFGSIPPEPAPPVTI